MDPGRHVDKYQVAAKFRQNVVEWTFAVETEDGQQHQLAIVDVASIPVLLELVQKDETVFFDPEARTLSTGWNDPGR
ncbi:MAG: hypothetical protein KKB50_19505 [Planctomycetes bacterium]|nr:hypothetical protein [Planctomycetota bacterium]